MSAGGRRAAFFDVDETLTTVVSMLGFLRFDLAARGLPDSAYDEAMARLAEARANGRREEANLLYYRNYAGRPEAELAALGREWFARELAGGSLFHPRALAAFQGHRRQGHLTVLVSGSFPPCLDPIGRHLGADLVICARPTVADGVHTGELPHPMIGRYKAQALAEAARTHGLDLDRSWAYGDHISDLPLLESVGHPVVVANADHAVVEQARSRNWTCWADTPAALPA
ncbi:HAD family hydrolase [Kitasatospora sp. NPDC058190]|uniref:HAD family hydrolase n=1 Tax=Kitasatospora sp. NPDC058190 TaxID=3346371 RepID=UPI0036DC8E84